MVAALINSTSVPGCDSDDARDTNGDNDGGGHDIDLSYNLVKTPALEGSYKDLSIELLEYFMIAEPLTEYPFFVHVPMRMRYHATILISWSPYLTLN